MDSPIVFIHGIKGSKLAQTYDDSFDVIWSGVQSSFESIWDLTLDPTGEVDESPFELTQVQQLEALAYGELLGKLRKNFSKTPIYIFRYDWRLDNKTNALRLDEFLALIKKKTQQETYRFITHSMGGLVLSAFLQLDAAKNLKRIDRAVCCATPFWGSIESMRALIVGDGRRFLFFSSEAFRKIARTFPSVYQLVPGYPAAWKHPEPKADIWNYDFWQARIKGPKAVMNLNKERDDLMADHLARAGNFHAGEVFDYATLSQSDAAKFLFVYGSGEKTLTQLNVLPKNSAGDVEYFFDFENSTYDPNGGDGTVPVASARRYSASKVQHLEFNLQEQSGWLPWNWDDSIKKSIAGFHGAFLGIDKVQGLVCDWMNYKNVKSDWQNKIKP